METTTQTQEWWYEVNGERKGPITEQEIISQINYGIIKRDNLVWKNGFTDWKRVEETDFNKNFSNESPPPLSGTAVNNTIVWWLAFAPIIGQILEGFFLEVFYPEPTVDYDSISSMSNYTDYLTNTNFNTFWSMTLILNIVLCIMDEKKLVKAGVDTSKMGSAWLIPIYLYKRAEVLKQSPAYFWVWLIAFIVTIIA